MTPSVIFRNNYAHVPTSSRHGHSCVQGEFTLLPWRIIQLRRTFVVTFIRRSATTLVLTAERLAPRLDFDAALALVQLQPLVLPQLGQA